MERAVAESQKKKFQVSFETLRLSVSTQKRLRYEKETKSR